MENTDLGIKVYGARCLVLEDVNEKKSKGLVRPDADKQPTFRGLVIAVGKGATLDNGTVVPMDIQVGDRIVYTSYAGSPIIVDGKQYVVLNERDILCSINK